MKKIASLLLITALLAGCGAAAKKTKTIDKNAQAHYLMGLAYLNTNSDHLAYKELKLAYESDKENDRYVYSMGLVLLRKNLNRDAAAYFKKAVALNPESSEYKNSYATALARQGRINEAVKYWDVVVNDPGYPYHILTYNNITTALFNEGRYADIPAYVDRALGINRMYLNGYIIKYNSYIMMKDDKNAEKTLISAVNNIPDNAMLKMRLANHYYERQEYSKAMPYLSEIVDKYPASEQAKQAKMIMKELGLLHE